MDNDPACFRDDLQLSVMINLDPQGWSLSFHRQLGMPEDLILLDLQMTEVENAAAMERAKSNKARPILGEKP
jgi:CheY-like chemotaxis protein